jgi:hypothetical protein
VAQEVDLAQRHAERFALAEAGVGAQHGERAIPTGHRINEDE